MKQFLDALMEKGKTTKDEFKGFELIKSINKTFLRESNFLVLLNYFINVSKHLKSVKTKYFL